MRFFSFLIIGIFFDVSTVLADWVNPTGAEIAPNIAEIRISDDKVRVAFEIHVDEIDVFRGLVGGDGSDSPDIMPFRVLRDEQVLLAPKVRLVKQRIRKDRYSPYAGMINPLTGQPFLNPIADKRVYYIEVDYQLDKKPTSLSFIPPMKADGSVAANIGFITFHNSVGVTDFKYLSAPATINLDWDDPWYSRYENKILTRHHKDPLRIYLYVEPRRARLEFLMRIRDFVEWSGMEPLGTKSLTASQQQKLKENVSKYFDKYKILSIDSKRVDPSAVTVNFIKLSRSTTTPLDGQEVIDIPSTYIGISQAFNYQEIPQNITVDWQFFSDRVVRIPVVITDPAGPFSDYVVKDSATIEWQNFLRVYVEPAFKPVLLKTGATLNVPLLGLIQIYNEPPTAEQAADILSGIFANMQVAYLEKDAANRRRGLANTSHTSKLDDLIYDLDKAFDIKVSSGGAASILDIEDLLVENVIESTDDAGFSFIASWQAVAVANHWGHTDRQRLQFRASIDIYEDEDDWKIKDFTLLDLKRIDL